jgi:U3 small nucleolar ribonucleoprotein component
MKLFGVKALLIFIAIVGLTACSASFEEVLEETKTAVESEFNKEADKPNNSNDDIEYRVPFGVDKEEETPNNILFKNGSRTYILFYNQYEESGSKVVYESTLEQHLEWDANVTFEQDGEFGYLLVKQLDEDNYQIVTGVGGVKLTTESKNLKSDAVTMMEIANSVKVK